MLVNYGILPSREGEQSQGDQREEKSAASSGHAGGLQAQERGFGFILGVADGRASGVVGHFSVEVDGGDFVAERLVAARDVDLGPFIVGAGQQRILVISQRLVEIAGGKPVPAALTGRRLHILIASAPSGARDSRCVVLILTRLELLEFLLLMLELFLLLLNQLIGSVNLIAHAS